MIQRALIIDEPWLGLILSGQKHWEMRSSACRIRGTVGLILKGSGQVFGIADVVSCSGPHSNETLADTFDRHRVGPEHYEQPDYNWRFAWELSNVIQLEAPVPYQHKNGAVKWVSLDARVSREVQSQLAGVN